MRKYLYLTSPKFVKTWVEGGNIPLALASHYVSTERQATYTPDETRIHSSPIDLTTLSPFIRIGPDSVLGNFTMTGSTFDGVPQPDIVNATYDLENGLILCFSNNLDRSIAEKLGKRACVEITDVEALKASIDEQLGTEGLMKECEYTESHERNTFLKSSADSWQDEFRIYWPIVINNAEVSIPGGLSKEVTFEPPLTPAEIATSQAIAQPEFGAEELESIKTVIIEYLKKSCDRPVSKVELCSVVLQRFKQNHNVTARIIDRLVTAGLINVNPCIPHTDHIRLTESGLLRDSETEIDIPDPRDREHFWTYPLPASISDMCPLK
jgi:hypothetical protein